MKSFAELKSPELHEIARQYKIKGHSKLKRADLISLIESRLKMLKSGQIKIKGGKSVWGKVTGAVHSALTGSTGSKTGDIGAASATATLQQNPSSVNQRKLADDTADNYYERRSHKDKKAARIDSELDREQVHRHGRTGWFFHSPLGSDYGAAAGSGAGSFSLSKKGKKKGIKGGQLPNDVLDALKKLKLTVKGHGLSVGGGEGDEDDESGPLDSALQGIFDKGMDKGQAQIDKQIENAEQMAIDQARSESEKIYQDLIQEDSQKDDPNFVRNPTGNKTLDFIHSLPTKEDFGPAGDAVDKGLTKADKMLMKPFQAAMEAAGVPEDAAKLITEISSPYNTLKGALKILKVTSRSGAVQPGERVKYASRLSQQALVPKSILDTKDDRAIATYMMNEVPSAQRTATLKAALFGYDMKFPDSEEAKYAISKRKPPYDDVRYWDLIENQRQMAEYEEMMKEKEKLEKRMERDKQRMDEGTYFMTDEERRLDELMKQGVSQEKAQEMYDYEVEVGGKKQANKNRRQAATMKKNVEERGPRGIFGFGAEGGSAKHTCYKQEGNGPMKKVPCTDVNAPGGQMMQMPHYHEPPSTRPPTRGKGADEPIDWDDVNWGSFTEQLNKYNSTYKKKLTLPKFADLILKDPKKYKQKTVKRARFYVNVLSKKK